MNSKRVYIWLSVQLLITISGILFLWVQAETGGLSTGNMTLAPFYLDSGDLYQSGNYERLKGGVLLQIQGGRLKVDDGRQGAEAGVYAA